MIIALDWDGTAASDPEGFAEVVRILRERGHKVFICTMRHEDKEPISPALLLLFRDDSEWDESKGHIEVVYTGRKAKHNYCNMHGIHVDVWIDDQPHFLYVNG